jgi:hypothetical protein
VKDGEMRRLARHGFPSRKMRWYCWRWQELIAQDRAVFIVLVGSAFDGREREVGTVLDYHEPRVAAGYVSDLQELVMESAQVFDVVAARAFFGVDALCLRWRVASRESWPAIVEIRIPGIAVLCMGNSSDRRASWRVIDLPWQFFRSDRWLVAR